MPDWVPFRVTPKLPVQAYQTYQAVRPRATHTKPATCQQAGCQAYAHGWVTLVDVATGHGRTVAQYIRLHSGRSFTASEVGTQVTFTFPPGQRCFAEHVAPLDKPTIYLKRGGDWRATTFPPVRLREVDWVDDFANHQDGVATVRRRA